MTGWIKDNKLKTISTMLGIIISIVVLLQFLPNPITVGAERVYEEKKPEMIEILGRAIEVQELRQEPRLRSIEMKMGNMEKEQTEQKLMMIDSMAIQREILAEVKK